jgi:hypothetical protein
VDEATDENILRRSLPKTAQDPAVDEPSSRASLDRRREARRILPLPTIIRTLPKTPVASVVHRFEESIAGRPYTIEAMLVSTDRWRAYIVRIPGVPTALMPFYGRTADEAAHQLCQWLTRAHQRAAASSTDPSR